MNDQEFIQMIEGMRNTMVSVSTGGQRIQEANAGYQSAYREVDIELRKRSLENSNPYSDLWDWYGRWSSGDLPTYIDHGDNSLLRCSPLYYKN